MCGMCESDNYDALRELENQYYNSSRMSYSNGRRPTIVQSVSPKTSIPSTDQMALRRSSLSTCFNGLQIQQQTQTERPPIFSKPNFAYSSPLNLLSPPSSPRSSSLPLLAKVSEQDEQQVTHEEVDGVEAQPCRRFQRQILSRLQVLNQSFPQSMEQDHDVIKIATKLFDGFQQQQPEAITSRYTPPPSPPPHYLHPHIDKSRRTSSTPSSRKGSFARSTRVRLPSLAELELGVLPPISSTRASLSALSGGRRRVSTPNPSSTAHLSSKGGIKKVGSGCGRKAIVDTPFKSGWSFSTAYGKGK